MATYTVKKGDSWARIAGNEYGDQRWMQLLANANGNVSLRPGMVINLPNFDTGNISSPPVTNSWAAIYAPNVMASQDFLAEYNTQRAAGNMGRIMTPEGYVNPYTPGYAGATGAGAVTTPTTKPTTLPPEIQRLIAEEERGGMKPRPATQPVKNGDTWLSLATENNIDPAKLVAANYGVDHPVAGGTVNIPKPSLLPGASRVNAINNAVETAFSWFGNRLGQTLRPGDPRFQNWQPPQGGVAGAPTFQMPPEATVPIPAPTRYTYTPPPATTKKPVTTPITTTDEFSEAWMARNQTQYLNSTRLSKGYDALPQILASGERPPVVNAFDIMQAQGFTTQSQAIAFMNQLGYVYQVSPTGVPQFIFVATAVPAPLEGGGEVNLDWEQYTVPGGGGGGGGGGQSNTGTRQTANDIIGNKAWTWRITG